MPQDTKLCTKRNNHHQDQEQPRTTTYGSLVGLALPPATALMTNPPARLSSLVLVEVE
jgi:hypothetical protein